MKAPACPSCGRPLGHRLAACPYCGERIPGSWRRFIPAVLALPAIVLAIPAASSFREMPRLSAISLTIVALALFAPFPRKRPGTAAIGRGRRAAALAARLAALVLAALVAAMATAKR